MMEIIKVKISEVTDGAQQKEYSATGRAGEEFVDRSYYQHVGFSSIPRAGSIGLVVSDGQNYSMVASVDKEDDRPVLSNEGDTVLYSDADKYVKISDSGEVEMSNGTNSIFLRANGDIDLGEGVLKKLMTEAMITVYNAHTHPTTSPGSPTGPPVVPLIAATHATVKVSGQ